MVDFAADINHTKQTKRRIVERRRIVESLSLQVVSFQVSSLVYQISPIDRPSVIYDQTG